MHDWHIRLYNKSVTKQLKFRHLRALAGDGAGKRCLDLGADNGVISYLFRQGGGDWSSADIDPRTVELIRGLVGGDVRLIANDRLPFADSEFDTAVIIDMLEHLADDRGFLLDPARALKEGGTLVVNVPRRKGFSLVRRLRAALGLTDDQHGHVRPGYTRGELAALLAGSGYAVERCVTYSRFFTELVDVMVSFSVAHALSGEGEGSKGTLVSGADLSKHGKKFAFFSLVYPFMWLLSRLDWLLFFMPGDKMAVRARRLPAAEAAAALEPPDIETASDEYAGRFGGAVGEYFLDRQNGIILGLLRPWPGAAVLTSAAATPRPPCRCTPPASASRSPAAAPPVAGAWSASWSPAPTVFANAPVCRSPSPSAASTRSSPSACSPMPPSGAGRSPSCAGSPGAR